MRFHHPEAVVSLSYLNLQRYDNDKESTKLENKINNNQSKTQTNQGAQELLERGHGSEPHEVPFFYRQKNKGHSDFHGEIDVCFF